MNIPRELIEDAVRIINKAFEFDGDVFGMMHNDAVDTLESLERALEKNHDNQD